MLSFIVDFLFDLLIFTPSILKRRVEIRREWSGTVERKKARAARPASRHGYAVVFRTEEGRRRKLLMGKADFDLYQEGRRYTKKAGAYLPDPHSAA